MKKIAILLLFICFIISSNTYASTWLKLSELNEYIDTESITSPSQGIVRVWYRIDTKDLLYNEKYLEFHCKEKRVRTLSGTKADVSSGVHHIEKTEWDHIDPITVLEDIHHIICEQ